MDFDLRAAALGFAGAAIVLAILIGVVGVGNVIRAFAALHPQYILFIVLAAAGWLMAWGLALRTVLGAMGVPASRVQSILMYTSAAFANNVTPFGQAGGEPVSALLISRSTGSAYEDGLAAIASVDTLNFAPSIGLAMLGVAYYVATFTVGSRDVLLMFGVVVGFAVLVPIVGYVAWQRRRALRELTVRTIGPVLHAIGRVIPRVTPPTPAALRERVSGFFGSLERVAGDRRRIGFALGYSTIGWLFMIVALWLSLLALGAEGLTVFAASLVVVPLGGLASITPLPGGLGGVEFAIVVLVVPITGVTAETATAAALVFRGATYWLPTLVGAGTTVLLGGTDSPP